MPTPKRLAKAQEQIAVKDEGSKVSSLFNRLLDEVAAPLDESTVLCQRLLGGSSERLPLEQRKWVETLHAGVERSARRLRDYVDLILLETGELALRPKSHSLMEGIEQVASQWRPLALRKRLGLVIEPSVRPLPPVLADPLRVRQILSHLLANALQFTERGQVTISTELYDRSIAIHVVDTGAGIPVAQLPRLFEDFYQGDDGRTRSPFGRGVGLTLSRRLVLRIGGDLWATSTVGAGSKFSFTVPQAPRGSAPARLAPV
jgi:signal transduction histidine kinase